METVLYKRATFATQLPVPYLYTQAHTWISRTDTDTWRVGYTKFALRMLGELVEVQFDLEPQSAIAIGGIVGTVEGFKAISDIYAVGQGRFVGGNPALALDLESVAHKPYDAGWFYEFAGEPDSRAMDVDRYRGLLDATIDRMLERQHQEEKTL